MGARQKQWAKVARKALLLALGNKCAACEADNRLEFDCIAPQGHAHHKLDSARRVSFYRREARRGNLQVLCCDCNSLKGGLSQNQWQEALQHARISSSLFCSSRSPGEGTELPPREFRQCLVEWVRRFHASMRPIEEINEPF